MPAVAPVDRPAVKSSKPRAGPVPLFLFGVARSGTTFAAYLFNNHPRIRFAHEARSLLEGLYLYRHCADLNDPNTFRQLLERLARVESGAKANRWMVDGFTTRADELYRRHRAAPSFANLIESVFLLSKANLLCWGSKLIRPEYCSHVLRLWPHAKIVLLIRDPRAAFASQRKYFNMRPKYSAIYWNMHAALVRAHAADTERFLLARYEDLMADTPGQLERLLRFCGAWDPRIAEETAAALRPRTDSLLKWKVELSPSQIRTIEEHCFEGMRTFDYAPELAAGPRRIGSLGRAVETIAQYARQVPLSVDFWRRKRLLPRFVQMIRSGVPGI